MRRKEITLKWVSPTDITHKVTVIGVHVWRENYGADADGNRGVMTDFVEYDDLKVEPAVSEADKPAFEKYAEEVLEGQLLDEVYREQEISNADFGAYDLEEQ